MKKQLVWADIHMHSTASDGSFTPAALVVHAKECGLGGMSITDHDTTAAYHQALPVAQELGIKLGVGIEFSCVFEGYDVHLLGYDFDLGSPGIETLCARHKTRRLNRNLAILEKLRSNQMDISMEDIKEHGASVGRPHIAQAMVKKGYVGSMKEAFNRFLGEGKSCYVRGDILTVDETIDAIHAATGKAFIAHPHLFMPSFPLEHLLARPWDGIECWYAHLSQQSAEPWVRIANEKKWLMSGGSDFHGAVKPDSSLGSKGVSQATFLQIFEKAR